MDGPELTAEEKEFIINILRAARFSGDVETIRKAIFLVDSIAAKLSDTPPVDIPTEL